MYLSKKIIELESFISGLGHSFLSLLFRERLKEHLYNIWGWFLAGISCIQISESFYLIIQSPLHPVTYSSSPTELYQALLL